MDYLWTPWRYQYITSIKTCDRCVFCLEPSTEDDKAFILFRGKFNFVILNIFPYTSGHLLVTPYQHIARFEECSDDQLTEMIRLAQRCQRAIQQTYDADGFNIGMNLGRCAGAGVEHPLPLHVVPRWVGDSNFMTVLGETRVLPESLEATYSKLKPLFS